MKSKFFQFLIALGAFVAIFSSCKIESEKLDPSPGKGLVFSSDTFWFDTVFTDLKTPTLRIRVFNTNDKALKISSVYVNGVNGQFPFSFIINGRSGPTRVNDLTIEGKDSVYVLLSAKINPQNNDLPFVVEDNLVFEVQGRAEKQNVVIIAYGQDAIYLKNTSIECNTTWKKDRPIIIFDTVSVKPNCTLTIEPGTKIYGYNAAFLIVRGELRAEGNFDQPIVFQGTRRESYYNTVPGQWGGILIMDGANGVFSNVVVKNAFRGIQVGEVGLLADPSRGNAFLLLRNSFIQNISDYGILGIKSGILAINNQFADCGEAGFGGLQGGDYEMYHNTFGLSGNNPFQRDGKFQVIFADNIPDSRTETTYGGKLTVKAVNNIIFGSEEEEIAFGEQKVIGTPFDTTFFNNIIRSRQNSYFIADGIMNKGNQQVPSNFRFLKPLNYYLAPDTLDDLNVFGTGLSLTGAKSIFSSVISDATLKGYLETDILGNRRPIAPLVRPDAGAYNNQKKIP